MADLTSGLTSRIDNSKTPAELRIEWIGWTSPFRDTALRVGDVVLGVGATPLVIGKSPERLVGGYAEASGLAIAGLAAGSALTLRVRQRISATETREIDVSAPLAEFKGWRNADNREIHGPDGPITLENDGFVDSWGGWAEPFQRKIAFLLDPDRHTVSFAGDVEAAQLVEKHGARVAFAVERYPGKWSAAVKADYDRALALITALPAAPAPPEPPAA